MECQKGFEQIITAIRFPLLLGVVLIHTSVRCDPAQAPVYSFLHRLFSDLLVAPCVPAFFFISGFLFFYNAASFDAKTYWSKLKRRFWTLLVPYLFWNLLVMGYYLLGHLCFPTVISPDNYNVAAYSFDEFLGLFWDYPGGFPICYQFWYIRDLMVIVLYTPILYILIKKMSKYVIFVLMFLYFCIDKHGLIGSGLLFALGSYFSIWRVDILVFLEKYKWLLGSLFCLSLLTELIIIDYGFIHRIMIVSGIGSFFYLAKILIPKKGHKDTVFDKSTFFVYGFHGFPIVLLGTTILPRIFGQSDIMCMLQYILLPLIIVFLSVAIFSLMRKICPRFLALLAGGRF